MWMFDSTRQMRFTGIADMGLFSVRSRCAKAAMGLLIGSAISAASLNGYGQEITGTWAAPKTQTGKVERLADPVPAIEFSSIPPMQDSFTIRQAAQNPTVQNAATSISSESPAIVGALAPTGVKSMVNATIVRGGSIAELPTSSSPQSPVSQAAQVQSGLLGVQNAGDSMLRHALSQAPFEMPQKSGQAIPQAMAQGNAPVAQQVNFLQQPAPVAQVPAQQPAAPQEEDTRQVIAQLGPDSDAVPGLTAETTVFFDSATGEFVIVGSDENIAIAREALKEILGTGKPEQRKPGFVGLKYSNAEDVVEMVQETYDANNAATSGKADIRAVSTPNGLFVTGQKEAIDAVREIVGAMESGATGDMKELGFKRFPLNYISAVDAKRRLDGFFGRISVDDGGENSLPEEAVSVIADARSNVVVVKGSPLLIQQAEAIIASIDVDDEALAVDVVRVFPLQNTVASDLQAILQDAINGQLLGAGSGFNPNQQLQNTQNGGQTDDEATQLRQSRLQLQSLKDGKVLESGLLFGVRVSAEAASNSLIVRGPESSMPLIAELIRQLDRLPNAETQIKVFQVINGDATQLLDMLEQIFGTEENAGQNTGNGNTSLSQLPLQSAGASPGAPLVDLRFAVEQRTNSIIATGSASELQVVESLLNRLDENVGSRRQTIVYRLSNSPVLDVEQALNVWITAQNQRITNDPRSSGGAVQANLGVIVASEVVSNSLIINALPEQFAELERVIQSLDRRPPMVKVECLIAEVDLGTLEEFGIELGLQDSLLFDRGTSVAASGALTGIGFPFNSGEVPNANGIFPETLAGQALSNLGVGRINNEVGYGGLVLSAGNESINILMRALKDKQCLRVLSRPTIMTMENLQGRTSVGQQVSRITGTSQNAIGGGVSNQVEEVAVGVILEVTPRVSPDGMIVMFVNAVKSSLGAEADGVVVAVDATGAPVRQAPINSTEAQTTIMARSGQTVVFSGLIQETKQHSERGTPILSDLPIIGPLFKFESDQAQRSELLIVMTPYLIDGEGDVEAQNRAEMDRMHWCLCDVAEMYGNMDYQDFQEDQGAMNTFYPDQDPTGMNPQQYPSGDEVFGQPLSAQPSAQRKVQQASGVDQARDRAKQAKFEEPVKEQKRGFFSELSSRNKTRRSNNATPGNRSGFDEFKTRFNKK